METIYEDKDIKVLNKPAGINADDIEGRIHRLDKDTSGVLLTAKTPESLAFFQDLFKTRQIKKIYIALLVGNLKQDSGTIETLLGRSPGDRRKQKVFLANEPGAEGKRMAQSRYRVLKKFQNYDLVEIELLTGRKHQIRAQFSNLGHPVAGDKLYGFKGQSAPEGLKRQFLHAKSVEIRIPDGSIKTFEASLPEELKEVLNKIT